MIWQILLYLFIGLLVAKAWYHYGTGYIEPEGCLLAGIAWPVFLGVIIISLLMEYTLPYIAKPFIFIWRGMISFIKWTPWR